ncbi:response regulator [Paenibacillus agricola]|uniref:Response regulator n=1 Tax=Paenibacillus agricola TaxID=2716264 RepID=A0ABX0JJ11_9BACL|nr:response regulator [Paenibacillus agricola]NHN35389.1 response regulator [Paenibacillus agricola]
MYKVLLVDDEIYIRKGLRTLVEWNKYGFEICDEAENGEQAFDLICSQSPDLVITDIKMPVLDGLDLIKNVVSSSSEILPKFIILTGFNDFKFAQQAVRYGVYDFILKPVDEDELESTLEKLSIQLKEAEVQQSSLAITRKIFSETALERLITGSLNESMVADYPYDWYTDQAGEYFFLIVEVFWNCTASPYDERKRRVAEALSYILGPNRGVPVIELQLGKYGLVLSINDLQHDEHQLGLFIDSLHRHLFRLLGAPVSIYIGNLVKGIQSLKHSYETAVEVMKYKFLVQDSNVIFYHKVKDISMQYTDLDNKLYSSLKEYVEDCDSGGAESVVNQMFVEFQKKRMVPQVIHASISRCILGIVELIKQEEGSEHSLQTFDAITNWDSKPFPPAELKRLFLQFIFESIEQHRQLRKRNSKYFYLYGQSDHYLFRWY